MTLCSLAKENWKDQWYIIQMSSRLADGDSVNKEMYGGEVGNCQYLLDEDSLWETLWKGDILKL